MPRRRGKTTIIFSISGLVPVLGLLLLLLEDGQDLVPGLAGAVLAGLAVGILACFAVHRHYQRLLTQLGSRLASLRQAAATRSASATAPGIQEQGERGGIEAHLTALEAAFRQPISNTIQNQQEDQAPAVALRPVGEDRPVPPTGSPYPLGAYRKQMVALVSPSLYWYTATPALLTILGCSVEELPGRPFLDDVHPPDREALRQALEGALQDGSEHRAMARLVSRVNQGRGRYLKVYVMAERDAGGQPLQLRCHLLDITRQVRTEHRLKRRTRALVNARTLLQQTSEDLDLLKDNYRELYHHSPLLYFSLDPQGNLVAFNETLLRVLGHPRRHLLNQPYARLLAPASRNLYLHDPGQMLREGEVEAQWVRHDGTTLDVQIETTIKKDQGQVVRSRSVARDVSELKRLTRSLRAKAVEAAQANAQLRRAHTDMEEFSQLAGHDLKEPLATVEELGELLKREYGPVLEGQGRKYLDIMGKAGRHLGSLLDALLLLIQSGKAIEAASTFSWEAGLQVVRANVQELVARQQGTIQVAAPLPAIRVDSDRVVQLLIHLVRNALLYNKSVPPEVVVGATAPPPPRIGTGPSTDLFPPFVTLYVQDNGIGIERAYHDQVFRMFRRVPGGDEGQGTGAGLAICKRIVEAHGGRIWLESQPDRGTTVYFTLPRDTQIATDGQEPGSKPAAEEADKSIPTAAPQPASSV